MPFCFPLKFEDLVLWLAFNALLLLVTWQVLSPYYGKTNISINHRRLRNAAFAAAVLFLIAVAIGVIGLIPIR